MASSPRGKERFEIEKQLGCFPRSENKLRGAPGTSFKSSKDVFDEKEKELLEIRNYWQEEYKNKVSEVTNLEAALKDAIKSRNTDVEEMRMSYESELDARNSEISELRRTLDELMGTKEEILASAEKSTESKLRAKDAEITRLRIWLEEARKSNAQGRDVLSSCQRRITDKEMEIESLKKSNEESVNILEQQVGKLQELLSEVITEKDKNSENTKIAFDSVVEEKERQIAMLKESSVNELMTKDEETKRKEQYILRLQAELAEKETEIEDMHVTIQNLQSVIKVNEDERNKLIEAVRASSEAKIHEITKLQERQQKLLEHKENELMSLEFVTKEQKKNHEMELKEKNRRIEEMSAKLAWVEAELTHEWLEKGSKEDLNTKVSSLLKKMSDLKEEKEILERDVSGLVADIRAKENKLDDIQKKCESESQNKQVLQQDFDSLTHDLENWKSAMKLIEEERNFLEKEGKRLREDLERKSDTLREFECKVESLESTQENLRSKYEESQNENEELKINLDERENDVASLSRLLEDAKQQEHKLEAELEQLSEEVEILNEKHLRRKNEKEALERSLTHAVSLKEHELEEMQHKFEKTVIEQKYEVEKREEYWKEAIKVKDELVKDMQRSFEERVMSKEDEIQNLEKSLENTRTGFQSVKESLEKSLTFKKEEIFLMRKAFDENMKDKEDTIAEITAENKETLQKKIELEEAFEECKTKLNELTQTTQLQDSEITLTKDKISQLENNFRQKEEMLKDAKKEIEDLQAQLKDQQEHCVAEIKHITQSAEKGFKERENVAEKLKAILQGNAVKYRQSLQRREDKISALKEELENSNKDVEDMRVNLAAFIQESDENEAKLNRDLKILEDESASHENKILELKKCLERKNKELQMMEGNLISAVTEFENKQTLKDEDKKKLVEELGKERNKVQELEESFSLLKDDVEQKEQLIQELTAKYQTTDGELKETLSNLLRLQENFTQVKELLNLAESEKVCANEAKHNLFQELEKQKRSSNDKDGRIAVLLHKIKMLKRHTFETVQKHEKLEESAVTLQMKLNEKETEMSELKNQRENKEEELYQRSLLLEEMELKRAELEKDITELEKTVGLQKSEIEEAVGREEELKGAVQDLVRSLKDNELNTRALVSNLEEGKLVNEKLRSEYENFKASALKEQAELHEEVDHLHSELDKQEGLLLMLNKEKESLLSELGKTKQAEENTRTSLECHIKSLKKENASLTVKLASLAEESKQRSAEIAKINSALSSAEVSKEFLSQEVERLKISVLDKEESFGEVRKSLEAAQRENSPFKIRNKEFGG